MRLYKQTIFAFSTVAAAIVLLAYPLVATHKAQACTAAADVDCNPTTGNPHAGGTPGVPGSDDVTTGTETGNPHNSAGCSGNSHGETGTDTCPGSK